MIEFQQLGLLVIGSSSVTCSFFELQLSNPELPRTPVEEFARTLQHATPPSSIMRLFQNILMFKACFEYTTIVIGFGSRSPQKLSGNFFRLWPPFKINRQHGLHTLGFEGGACCGIREVNGQHLI